MASITCNDLGFVWHDGTVVLDHLDLALGPGCTGLIGVNGSGKSTLLEVIAGRLRPTAGAVQVDGAVGYLPQHVALRAGRRVDDVLGIARKRAALRALETSAPRSGDATAGALAVIGDDWYIEERARATLDRLGLDAVGLDRTVGTLSGGESVLLALAALFLRRPDVLLLDEPTNNLDLDARRRLYDAVAAFRGVLVVVSHDRALLDRVDRIAELHDGGVRLYGGNLTVYEQMVAQEQEAAQRRVRSATATVRRERRELVEARIKLDRRQRKARKQGAENRFPKVVAHERKRQAQVSAGKLRDVHVNRVAVAEAELSLATEAVRDDDEIRIDLPETHVPSRRTVLVCAGLNVAATGAAADGGSTPRLWDRDVDLAIRGPQRIALLGANGSGKTTLLRVIAGELAPASERFRATLAALLSARPPPQLLLLDEPTNNLDLASVSQLERALEAYRGALIVASHDTPLLRRVAITRWLRLDRATGLTELDAGSPSGRGRPLLMRLRETARARCSISTIRS